MAHSPHIDKNSINDPEAKHEMADLVTNGFLPDFLETLNAVSLDKLDDLKRRYAAFIIQIDRLRPALQNIDYSARADEDSWSICEILGHLIDTDRDIWWPRIEAARTTDHPHFENIDHDDLLRKHHWQSQPIEDILSQLVRSRWHYGMQLNLISEDEFERVGKHEVLGEITVLRMLQIMVAHDEYYLARMRAILNKKNIFPER